jgi:hypothetical protein
MAKIALSLWVLQIQNIFFLSFKTHHISAIFTMVQMGLKNMWTYLLIKIKITASTFVGRTKRPKEPTKADKTLSRFTIGSSCTDEIFNAFKL